MLTAVAKHSSRVASGMVCGPGFDSMALKTPRFSDTLILNEIPHIS